MGAGEESLQGRLVFSITLAQKRVRPPVWIILVLHAEPASLRALLVKGLDHSNLPSTLELVCDVLLRHVAAPFKKNITTAVTPGPAGPGPAETWSGPVETDFQGG